MFEEVLISFEELMITSELLICSKEEFASELTKKTLLSKIKNLAEITAIDTEKTIGQRTNFPYILLQNNKFYFMGIYPRGLQKRKQLIKDKNKLEKTLGIKASKIICYNPQRLGNGKTLRRLKKRGCVFMDLGYDEKGLSQLFKINQASEKPQESPDLQFRQEYSNTNQQNHVHYCDARQKQKSNCAEGFIKK